MHILHPLGLPGLRRRTADTAAKGNANAGDLSLERAEHQLLIAVEVKPRPVQVLDLAVEEGGKLRGIGDEITLIGQQ
ncbi:hypothetical protein D3C87_1934800 [compost metagenome]